MFAIVAYYRFVTVSDSLQPLISFVSLRLIGLGLHPPNNPRWCCTYVRGCCIKTAGYDPLGSE